MGFVLVVTAAQGAAGGEGGWYDEEGRYMQAYYDEWGNYIQGKTTYHLFVYMLCLSHVSIPGFKSARDRSAELVCPRVL
jgi:hypothetical protein